MRQFRNSKLENRIRPTAIFVVALVLSLVAAPLAAEAQQAGKMYRVGVLARGTAEGHAPDVAAFRERLVQLGYVEGQNLLLDARFADRQEDRLPGLAKELVRLNMDVIMTITTPAAQAAKAATTTIPIVMAGSADPITLSLVTSQARPGGNVTGVTNSPGPSFVVKQLQLLKEAAPKISRIAILMTNHPVEAHYFNAMQAERRALGVAPVSVVVDSPAQFDVARLTRAHPDALYIFPNATNVAHSRAILGFAATNRLPTFYGDRDWVAIGGLMSYSVNWLDLRKRAAFFVDKILRGAKPADLPVEDPTTFELAVNLQTAKALGLTIPQSILVRADEVIQ